MNNIYRRNHVLATEGINNGKSNKNLHLATSYGRDQGTEKLAYPVVADLPTA